MEITSFESTSTEEVDVCFIFDNTISKGDIAWENSVDMVEMLASYGISENAKLAISLLQGDMTESGEDYFDSLDDLKIFLKESMPSTPGTRNMKDSFESCIELFMVDDNITSPTIFVVTHDGADPSESPCEESIIDSLTSLDVNVIIVGEFTDNGLLNSTNCAYLNPEYDTTTFEFDSSDDYEQNIADIQEAFDIPTTPSPFDGVFEFITIVDSEFAEYGSTGMPFTNNPNGNITFNEELGGWVVSSPDGGYLLQETMESNPEWAEPWKEFDEDGNFVRDWPAIQVKCEHYYWPPTSFPSTSPTVYDECEYHELISIYVNSSESVDIVFVIDAVISDADERWQDTVEMLATFIEFSLPEDTNIAVVLEGGSSAPIIPVALQDESSKEEVIKYLQADMSSLGGDYNAKEAMGEATQMLKDDGLSETKIIFHVTHGPLADDSESPCDLSPEWADNNIQVITIMDGEVGPTAPIDCSESEDEFQSSSLYFNHTTEYELNMDLIQSSTGLEAESCIYDGWYQNTFGDRPGGYAEYATLPWMPINGTLYYSEEEGDWVVDTSAGYAVQMDGNDLNHPDWVGPFSPNCAMVQIRCGEPPELCPDFMEVASIQTDSTDETNICVVFDDTTPIAAKEAAEMLEQLIQYGLPSRTKVVVVPLVADQSVWLEQDAAISYINDIAESITISSSDRDIGDAYEKCIARLNGREEPVILLVSHGDPSDGQSPCIYMDELAQEEIEVVVVGSFDDVSLTDCSNMNISYNSTTIEFDEPEEYVRKLVDIQNAFPYSPTPTPFDGFFIFDSVVDGSAEYSPSGLWYTENPDGDLTYEDGVWIVTNPNYPGTLQQDSSSPFFPDWVAPWYEVDEQGNVVREWPAVAVQCEHDLNQIPSNYPSFNPTVYPECEYHELTSISVGSDDPIDIVFVIDAVIGDDDPRWQDTVAMLTDVITYMVPENSQLGVVLVGGDVTPINPLDFSEDPCPPCLVDYLQNEMTSLGGEYYTKESMEKATEILAGQGSNDDQMILHVTHGPPMPSQSPCTLHAIWHLQNFRIITIMDGDVGPVEEIDCSEEDFSFPGGALYFNHTNEYHLNMASIQAATGLPTDPCKYDGWYENTNGDRPGGYAEFKTVDWMPFNGTLYFDVNINDWVVDANVGTLVQMDGPDIAHPPWIGSWNEYAPGDTTYSTAIGECRAVQVSCGYPPEYCPEYMEISSFESSSTEEIDVCFIFDNTISTDDIAWKNSVDMVELLASYGISENANLAISLLQSDMADPGDDYFTSLDDFTLFIKESMPSIPGDRNIKDSFKSCLELFIADDNATSPTIVLVTHDGPSTEEQSPCEESVMDSLTSLDINVIIIGEFSDQNMLNATNCAEENPEYDATTFEFDSADEYDQNMGDIQEAMNIPKISSPFDGVFEFITIVDSEFAEYGPTEMPFTNNPNGNITYDEELGGWTMTNPDGSYLLQETSGSNPEWVEPWKEFDDEGNFVRDWPAIQVQCEHYYWPPTSFPTTPPTVYDECEYHELISIYVDSSEPVDIAFVIDATISDADERWDDTVNMLSNLIEYSLPEDSNIGVSLVGGSDSTVIPISIAEDTSKQDVIDYLENDMTSLGGENDMLSSLAQVTAMLKENKQSETQIIFHVTHGPPAESQSPCVLSNLWSNDKTRVVTIMDGDVGRTELIDCSESADEFPSASLYLNHTSEYELNMDKIQSSTGIKAEPCIYDGWYENTYGDRPGGFAEYATLSWMPINGTLYYSEQEGDWVIESSGGFAVQMDGDDLNHPDWVGPFSPHCPMVQIRCGEPPDLCAEFMEVASIQTDSTNETNVCIVFDDTVPSEVDQSAEMLEQLIPLGFPSTTEVIIIPLVSNPSAWLDKDEAIAFIIELASETSIPSSDRNIADAYEECLKNFDDRENPKILLVSNGDPSDNQSPCVHVDQLENDDIDVVVVGKFDDTSLTDCSHLDIGYTSSTIELEDSDEYVEKIVDIQEAFDYPTVPTPFDGFFIFDGVVDGSAEYSPSGLWYTENPNGNMTYEDGVWIVTNPDYPGTLQQNSSSPFFPDWIAPWYEVDEDGNVIREWPAVGVQCEHTLDEVPSNYPTFTPSVYPECEYHQLQSVAVGPSDPVDIVFVIDAVIGDEDPRWQDTVDMLTDVVTYMIPEGSRLGVVLVGGDDAPVIPLTLSEDPCPPCLVDYFENEMASLGGEYLTKEAMEKATEMLDSQGSSDDQMIFHVTHGAPLDSSQSPCSLNALWHLQGYRIITIMDGDVGAMEQIDCSEAEFSFPGESLYFNHTNEYHLNMVSIQEATGLPTDPCKYDGWYENTYGDRPGGFAEYKTLDWMPFNGSLYFDTEVRDWVVDANIGSLLQMNAPDLAYPPWISSWNEYASGDSSYSTIVGECVAVQVSCGYPPKFCPEFMEIKSFESTSSDDVDVCFIFDNTVPKTDSAWKNSVEMVELLASYGISENANIAISLLQGEMSDSGEQYFASLDDFTIFLNEDMPSTPGDRNIKDSFISCIELFTNDDNLTNPMIFMVTHDGPSSGQSPCSKLVTDLLVDLDVSVIIVGEFSDELAMNGTNCAHLEEKYDSTTFEFDSSEDYEKDMADIQEAFDIPPTPTPFDGFFEFITIVDNFVEYEGSEMPFTNNPNGNITFSEELGGWTVTNPDGGYLLQETSGPNPEWLEPWKEFDEDDNFVRDWPAVQVQCEHYFWPPTSFPTTPPTVYDECEYHELISIYVNSSESVDIVFVIDAVISDVDERWEDTVNMLSTFIEYSLPEESNIGVVLVGGFNEPVVPVSIANDPSKQEVIDYIQNEMASLGGENYILNSMHAATDMLNDNALSETQILFHVTHGPPAEEMESPCSLASDWSANNTRLITVMDGDIGPMELLDCSETGEDFPSVSLYFNHTTEYELNMDLIQSATGIVAEPCIYDGWYENTYGDRPGGFAEYATLSWTPINGTLYYSEEESDWVVDTSAGYAVQMDGNDLNHPDWVGPFSPHCPMVQIRCGEPPDLCPEFMELASIQTESTEEANICIIFDDTIASEIDQSAEMLEQLIQFGLPSQTEVIINPLVADSSKWLEKDDAVAYINDIATNTDISSGNRNIADAYKECIDSLEGREEPTILLVSHGDPSDGQSPCVLTDELAEKNIDVVVVGTFDDVRLTDCSSMDIGYNSTTIEFEPSDEFVKKIVEIQEAFPYDPTPTPFDGIFIFEKVVDGSAEYSPSRLW